MKKLMLSLMVALGATVTAQEAGLDSAPESGVSYVQEGKRIKMLEYDAAGNLLQEGYFLNGKPDGDWYSYAPDGTITAQISYDNGVRVGKWMIWTGFGQNELYEINYDNNVRTSVTKWTVDNQVAIHQ